MGLGRMLLWVLLILFIYKFVFDFLVPLVKVSLKMRQQIKSFQQGAARQQTDAFQQPNETAPDKGSQKNTAASPQPKAGDYIDFEEVKD